MQRLRSPLLIVSAAVLWGCIALFYDGLSAAGYSALQVVCIRVLTAAVLMGGYIAAWDSSWFRIRLKDVWMFIGTGVISLAFFNYCYFRAMDEISHSLAAVLLYTAPMFVMLFSAILFREKITARKCVALCATMIGCLLVTEVFSGGDITPIGLLFGIGSGVGYALYSIFGVVALRRYKSETITFYTFVFAALSVLPLCGVDSMTSVAMSHPLETILFGLGIAVFSCLLPYLLYTKGLEGVSAGSASVMATIEPVVASLIGILILGNATSVSKVIGMTLIIFSVVYLNLPRKRL